MHEKAKLGREEEGEEGLTRSYSETNKRRQSKSGHNTGPCNGVVLVNWRRSNVVRHRTQQRQSSK